MDVLHSYSVTAQMSLRLLRIQRLLQLGTSTTVTAVLDEDNMASDSATSLATQQSIKAYVDSTSWLSLTACGSISGWQHDWRH